MHACFRNFTAYVGAMQLWRLISKDAHPQREADVGGVATLVLKHPLDDVRIKLGEFVREDLRIRRRRRLLRHLFACTCDEACSG